MVVDFTGLTKILKAQESVFTVLYMSGWGKSINVIPEVVLDI